MEEDYAETVLSTALREHRMRLVEAKEKRAHLAKPENSFFHFFKKEDQSARDFENTMSAALISTLERRISQLESALTVIFEGK